MRVSAWMACKTGTLASHYALQRAKLVKVKRLTKYFHKKLTIKTFHYEKIIVLHGCRHVCYLSGLFTRSFY